MEMQRGIQDERLQKRLADLGVREADLEERFILGGGPGGQKINKTASCVQLHHPASGTEIRCQESRGLAANRVLARTMLCERLEAARAAKIAKAQDLREKRRRQKRGRSKAQKARMLDDKKHNSRRKAARRNGTD